MSSILICDLCKKPIHLFENSSRYKIRRVTCQWGTPIGWTDLDVHDECIEKILKAAHIDPPTGGSSITDE